MWPPSRIFISPASEPWHVPLCERAMRHEAMRTGRSSGSRIILLAAPSHPGIAPNSGPERAVSCARCAAFVPDHSGGTATELHRLPFTPSRAPVSVATNDRIIAPPGERVKLFGPPQSRMP